MSLLRVFKNFEIWVGALITSVGAFIRSHHFGLVPWSDGRLNQFVGCLYPHSKWRLRFSPFILDSLEIKELFLP